MCITHEMQNKVKAVSKCLCILRMEIGEQAAVFGFFRAVFLEEVCSLMMGGFLMGGGDGQAALQAPAP